MVHDAYQQWFMMNIGNDAWWWSFLIIPDIHHEPIIPDIHHEPIIPDIHHEPIIPDIHHEPISGMMHDDDEHQAWWISAMIYHHHDRTLDERWGAGVETQKNVMGVFGGWGRVPFSEPYAPSLSTIYDGA